jgi:hypothetical protein
MQVQFRLFPFHSPLLRESLLVSLPPPTWMLPFGGFLLPIWEFHRYHPWREVPFGHLRIEGCMRLPGAYRSLPRPSSAPEPGHPSGGLSCQTYSGTHTRLAFRPLHDAHRKHPFANRCPLQPSPPTFLSEAAFYSKRLAHSHHLSSSPPHLF